MLQMHILNELYIHILYWKRRSAEKMSKVSRGRYSHRLPLESATGFRLELATYEILRAKV